MRTCAAGFVFFSTVCFALAAWSPPFLAFHFPLELEVREGAGWLHLLARQAGVNLYDTSRVAFANLVYGPSDILIKTLAAFCLPWLKSYQIARLFVPLVPFTLCLVAWSWGRSLFDAFLLSGPLYLFFTCTDVLSTLVGRSDPLAFCLLNALLFFAAPRVQVRFEARRWLWLAIVGILATLAFHCSWRFAPFLCVVVGGSLVGFTLPARPNRPINTQAKELGWLFAIFFSLSLTLISVEYGGLGIYLSRTFGTFTTASGWGVFPTKSFSLVPRELVHYAPVFAAGAWLATLLAFWLNRSDREAIPYWVAALSLCWILSALGYLANGAGGGVRYFYPAILLLWVAGMHLFAAVERRLCHWRVWFCLLAWGGLPWRQVGELNSILWSNAPPAHEFTEALRRIPRGDLWSDCFHFFKLRYEGEVVDTPDLALKLGESGFLGSDFTRLVKTHFALLDSHPPPFYLAGQVDPPRVIEVYRRPEYQKRMEAPLHAIGNGFKHSATLYERK